MSDELETRLGDLARAVESAWPAPDAGTAARLAAGVTRRRRVRTVRQSVAAVAALAVLVPAAVLGADRLHSSPPAVVPGPTASATTPSSSTTASATPSASSSLSTSSTAAAGPLVRAETIDDSTVLARSVSPRTGEVWTTPQRAGDMDSTLAWSNSHWVPYLVGHRASTRIYVIALDGSTTVRQVAALVEVDSAGARQIACPSARSSDPCFDDDTSQWASGVQLDRSTFYDSFTLPSSVALGPGWAIRTAGTLPRLLGPGVGFLDDPDQYRPVATAGSLRVVESVSSVPGEAVDNRSYFLALPMGMMVKVDNLDVPGGDFDAIRWDAGKEPRLADQDGLGNPAVAAGGACDPEQFSEQSGFDAAGWARAGTTREGLPIYLPTDANTLPDTIWAKKTHDSKALHAVYGISSAAEFRAQDSLYAMRGPDGSWQLRLRSDARTQGKGCYY